MIGSGQSSSLGADRRRIVNRIQLQSHVMPLVMEESSAILGGLELLKKSAIRQNCFNIYNHFALCGRHS